MMNQSEINEKYIYLFGGKKKLHSLVHNFIFVKCWKINLTIMNL